MTTHTRRLPGRFPLTLIPSLDMETFVAHPAALPLDEVAVPFTVDDRFHSHSKVVAISLAARGLWVSAGAWSSDHRKGGVVPDRVLATLGCTPELEAELLIAGLWKRVRRGVRFHDWEQWNDTAEKAAERDAKTERQRELGRLRAQRKRARDRGEEPQDVTRASRAARDDVTRPEYPDRKKPQVRGAPVTRDIGVTATVTPLSDDQDLNHDQNPSSRGNGNRHLQAAPPREDDELVAAVVEALCETTGAVISGEQALRAIGVIRRRKRGKPIFDPMTYIPAAARNEADPWAELLLPAAPSGQEVPAQPPPRSDLHEYVRNPATGVCTVCDMPRSNTGKHAEARIA